MTRRPKCYGPAPDIRGSVHDYWIQRREARLAARKQTRKLASKRASKQAKKPLDLWTPVG